LTKETINLPEAEKEIPGVIKHMRTVSVKAVNEMKDSLAKFREAEKNIRELDPHFKSSYEKQWFE
jgi:hypothetical protein